MSRYREGPDHAQSMRQLRQACRDVYAWPGGYSIIVSTTDGATLCAKCARKEYTGLSADSRNGGAEIYIWAGCDTDSDTPCDSCGEQLGSHKGPFCPECSGWVDDDRPEGSLCDACAMLAQRRASAGAHYRLAWKASTEQKDEHA